MIPSRNIANFLAILKQFEIILTNNKKYFSLFMITLIILGQVRPLSRFVNSNVNYLIVQCDSKSFQLLSLICLEQFCFHSVNFQTY